MGVLSAVTAATGPLPVARQVPNPAGPVPVAPVAATFIDSPSRAVLPVQAKTASASLAPERSQSTAAKLMVETVDGIELDNIPFTNDGAVLLDDLPVPEKPTSEPTHSAPQPAETAKPDLSQRATRGYLASREAAPMQSKPADPLFGDTD